MNTMPWLPFRYSRAQRTCWGCSDGTARLMLLRLDERVVTRTLREAPLTTVCIPRLVEPEYYLDCLHVDVSKKRNVRRKLVNKPKLLFEVFEATGWRCPLRKRALWSSVRRERVIG
jgi:hypothetical protein